MFEMEECSAFDRRKQRMATIKNNGRDMKRKFPIRELWLLGYAALR